MHIITGLIAFTYLLSNIFVHGASVSTTQAAWQGSIDNCKAAGAEILTPWSTEDFTLLSDTLTDQAGKYWTSLRIQTSSADFLEWGGITIFDSVETFQLPWKPGLRPTSLDTGKCVAIEVTKLTVVFYPEDCSTPLFSYCRPIDSLLLFEKYEDPPGDLNSTAPLLSLTNTPDSDHCAYECFQAGGCVMFTYINDTKECHLFDTRKTDQKQNDTWTIERCPPLSMPLHVQFMTADTAFDSEVYPSCDAPYTCTPTTCHHTGHWSALPACYTDARDCDVGDVSYAGTCYRFSPQPLTWHRALEECEGAGGHLLVVEDQDQMDVVDKLLYQHTNDTWIGATDDIKTGWWHFPPSFDNKDFFRWHGNSGDDTGHCMQLRRYWNNVDEGQFYFDDTDCTDEKHFVCEIGRLYVGDTALCGDHTWCRRGSKCTGRCRCLFPIGEQQGDDDQSDTTCQRTWVATSSHEFTEVKDSIPQEVAQLACEVIGGSLVTPVNLQMHADLTQYYLDKNLVQAYYMWSSLKLEGGGYVDGGVTGFRELEEQYLPWRRARLYDRYSPGDCAILELSRAGAKLHRANCDLNKMSICVRVNISGRTNLETGTTVDLEPMDTLWPRSPQWCGAMCFTNTNCTSYGYVNESQTCHLFNDTAVNGTNVNTTMDYWTKSACTPITSVPHGTITSVSGETDIGTELSYVCDPNYNRTNSNVTCMDNSIWSSVPMCYPDGPPCPQMWERRGASCYLIVETENTWWAASEMCQNLTGYLVEIDDVAERDFLINLLDYDYNLDVWTGATDMGMQHWYRWKGKYDEISSDILDWFPGEYGNGTEPTGYTYNSVTQTFTYEDCISLKKYYDGFMADKYYFYDDECSATKKSICETKVLNVGSSGCSVYLDQPCKDVSLCEMDECRCPYDTHRQTGIDDLANTTCDEILPVGDRGCKERDDLCYNVSVCVGNRCECPGYLFQDGQDRSFATMCAVNFTGCAEEWRAEGNKCYKMFEEVSYDLFNPDQECIKQGGVLGSPKTLYLNEFFLTLGSRANKWIGLHGRHGSLAWADGTLLDVVNDYTAFRPSDDERNDTCIYLSMQGTWIKDECFPKSPTALICEMPSGCYSPPNVTHSVYTPTEEYYSPGSVHEYTCATGYVIGGAHTGKVTCKPIAGISNWELEPSCVSITGTIFGSTTEPYGMEAAPAVVVTNEDECATECYDMDDMCVGYTFTYPYCNLYTSLHVTNTPGTVPISGLLKKRTMCPPVPTVNNTEIVSASRSIGDSIDYACTPLGRLAPGSNLKVMCQDNGLWADLPRCIDRFKVLLIDTELSFGAEDLKAMFNVPSLQECELRCMREREFRCLSLRYQYGECHLYKTRIGDLDRLGKSRSSNITVYAELSESDLNEFHTYFETNMVTSPMEVFYSLSLEECAKACLGASGYDCLTFVIETTNVTCSLYEEHQAGNTESLSGHLLFSRHLDCGPPPSVSGMLYTDDVRKDASRYSVGDAVTYTCDITGEHIVGDWKVYCQQSGKWTKTPVCRNLCETGWYSMNGNCYKIFNDLQTFEIAGDNCLLENAMLLNMETPDEIPFIADVRFDSGIPLTELWVGIRYDLGKWAWTERTVGNWSAVSSPMPTPTPNTAIAYDVTSSVLNAVDIAETRGYICKKALLSLRCPNDDYYFNRTCYLTSLTDTVTNFAEAELACNALGYMLATPHNHVTMDAILRVIKDYSSTMGYLGVMKFTYEDWTYVDGSPLDYMEATGVSGSDQGEKCWFVGDNELKISYCNTVAHYVCQAPLADVGVSTDYSNTPCVSDALCEEAGLKCLPSEHGDPFSRKTCRHPECPSWMKYERGRCFHVSDRNATLAEATAECGKRGSRVVSIRSMDQNLEWFEFVERHLNNAVGFWVGYDRFLSELRLKVDPLGNGFQNWLVSMLLNDDTPACVGHSQKWDGLGKWGGEDCNKAYLHYACEIDVNKDTTTNLAYYEGCFERGDFEFTSFEKHELISVTMDITECRQHCLSLGYKFAALKSGEACSCGQMLELWGGVDDSSCDTPCPGNALDTCGGTGYFSVYRTTEHACTDGMPSDPSDPSTCYSMSIQATNWRRGRYTCGRNGGELVSIENLEKQAFLSDYVFNEPGGTKSQASIGVFTRYDSSEFNYYTTANTQPTWRNFFGYLDVNVNDVALDPTYLDCAIAYIESGRWANSLCRVSSKKYMFACQYRDRRGHQATGNVWRRLMFEELKPYESYPVEVNISTKSSNNNRHHHALLFSNATLYSRNLDLGCLNNHQLCPEGFTFMFLIFIDTAATSDIEILATGDCVSSTHVGPGFCVYFSSSTDELVFIDATDETSTYHLRLTIPKGSWHHLSVVFDGNETVYVYLNGGSPTEFGINSLIKRKHSIAYDWVLFGNWHEITSVNDILKLHDVRFKPQKMTWNEIFKMFNDDNFLSSYSHWLVDGYGQMTHALTQPDPGIDGHGMRLNQRGSVLLLSSDSSCLARIQECTSTGDFMTTFWMKFEHPPFNPRTILTMGDVAGGHQGLQVQLDYFSLHVELRLVTGYHTGVVTLSENTWHLIYIGYKAVTGELRIAVDGVVMVTAASTAAGVSTYGLPSSLTFGHAVCPLTWIFKGRSCYHFENTPTTVWGHAKLADSHGAHLINVDSIEEEDLLYKMMLANSTSRVVMAHTYVGPSWSKGSEIPLWRTPGSRETFYNDTMADTVSREFSCQAGVCQVEAMHPAHKLPAVYEIDLGQSEFPIHNACPTGWKYFEDSCYLHLGETLLSAAEAVVTCSEHRARPVDIDSEQELRFVAKLAHGSSESKAEWSTIVGISREQLANGSKMYVKSDLSAPGWSSWGFKPPSADLSCVKLLCVRGGCYYVDIPCTGETSNVTCERDAGSKCGPGWLRSGDECYAKHVVTGLVDPGICAQHGYVPVVLQHVDHLERILYDLNIGPDVCLTDARLTGGNYTWNSTGNIAYFDQDMAVKTEACVSITGSEPSGILQTCTANCTICMQETHTSVSIDNIRFYERTLTSSENAALMAEGDFTTNQLNCSIAVDTQLSDNSIECLFDGTSIAMTSSGPINILKDTLDRKVLDLGSGVEHTFTNDWLDLTSAKSGLTTAFWLYTYDDSESVLIQTLGSGVNGLKITLINRTLSVKVHQPNFVWSTWTWFPARDWTHVTITWHEAQGLSLFVNAELISTARQGSPKPGYNTSPSIPTTLKLAQRIAGTAVSMKTFVYTNHIWTEYMIDAAYDQPSVRYHLSFDEQYKPGWDNLPVTYNTTVSSLVWRNSLFYNALHVNNTEGTTGYPAATYTGQMRNCFTRPDSCRNQWTLSFWLRPLEFTKPQSYITAFTPSPMEGKRSVGWEVIYDNMVDKYNFTGFYGKMSITIQFAIDFFQWSHLHFVASNELQLYVNGELQAPAIKEYSASHVQPMQPFSYLEIGAFGTFDIDDIQFFVSEKQPSEIYLLRTCHEYNLAGFRGRRYLQVGTDPSDVNTVDCEFTTGLGAAGVTHIEHDKEGYQDLPPGVSTMAFTYSASNPFIQTLVQESTTCQQQAHYSCQDRALFGNPGSSTNYWTSLDGNSHSYWAGADDTVPYSCLCSLDGTCDAGALCNCDTGLNDGTTRMDSGNFTKREYLPVSSVSFGGGTGTASIMLGTLECFSAIGFHGLDLTFDTDSRDYLSELGVGVSFTGNTVSFVTGINEDAFKLTNVGYQITGTNSRCLQDLTNCDFGFSLLLWMMIEEVTNIVSIFELGGHPGTDQPGLWFTCDAIAGDAHRALCLAESKEGSTLSNIQFHLQKNRWMQVAITWNRHLGLNVLINGHDLADLGVIRSVSSLTLQPLATTSDVRIGYSFVPGREGVWSMDNVRLVERDVSIVEVRKHFGEMSACTEGWVYNPMTGLCYNATASKPTITHYKAEEYCQSLGATLATELDSTTHTWFIDNIFSLGILTSSPHLGLRKTGLDGSYRWSDGRLASHITLASAEPNNVAELCVKLIKGSWAYKSVSCGNRGQVLCQKEPSWLPNKEISLGADYRDYNYTQISTVNSYPDVEGIVGNTVDLDGNYALEHYIGECINNIMFCHNGWSFSTWLFIDRLDSSPNKQVFYSSNPTGNSYGIDIFGKLNVNIYYMRIVIDDSYTRISTWFAVTTHAWTHIYVSMSPITGLSVVIDGHLNTYIEPIVGAGTSTRPAYGTRLPLSLGASTAGGDQMVGQMDEVEVFEHELLDLQWLHDHVSTLLYQTTVEHNMDFNDMLTLGASTVKLPGKFGYSIDLKVGDPVYNKAQFAFDCFGSPDRCPEGFTLMFWVKPHRNEITSTNFGMMSATNRYRGFKFAFWKNHGWYPAYPEHYFATVRDGKKEYNFPFQLIDQEWNHILLSFRDLSPVMFLNGQKIVTLLTKNWNNDGYPVVRLHFGKMDDGFAALGGFAGGFDEFSFWSNSTTDETAIKLYKQTLFVEDPIQWNTTLSGLAGNSLILTDTADFKDLTSSTGGTCYVQDKLCDLGMTVSIIFKFLGLNDHDQTIFTAGGNGSHFFFRLVPQNESMPFRRYFEFGLEDSDRSYSVMFNLRYYEWTHVLVEYRFNDSLKVLVDKQLIGEDSGEPRTSSSVATPHLFIGKMNLEINEKPNFEIRRLDIWDKAVNGSLAGQVTDYMHFVHHEINYVQSYVVEDITYSQCYDHCEEDDLTLCNSFSYYPKLTMGDCHLITDHATVASLLYNDTCDSYVPVNMPYLDYFKSCVADSEVWALVRSAVVDNWEECRRVCHDEGKLYAGLWEGVECYCDDKLGDRPGVNPTLCDLDCSTINGETCGGGSGVSVYDVGNWRPFIEPLNAVTSLDVAFDPGLIVGIGDNINLTITVNAGTFAGYFISTEAMPIDFFTGFNLTQITTVNPGKYTLSIRALNEISYMDYVTDVFVFIPLSDMTIDYQGIVVTGDSVTLTATVYNGTNITCDIQYDDGNTDSMFYPNDTQPFIFGHAYTSQGVYFIQVICSNPVSSITKLGNITVENVITDLQVSVDEIVRHPDPLNTNWSIATGTNVTFDLFLDNIDTNVENYLFGSLLGSGVIPQPLYNWTGEHTLVLRGSNLVSESFVNKSIIIEIPIFNVTVTTNGTFHLVGTPVRFTVTIAKGSNLTIMLHLDGSTSVELTSNSNSYDHNIVYDHAYSYAAELEVNVTVSNIHGTTSSLCAFVTEITVEHVDISADDIFNPVDYDLQILLKVAATLQIPSNALVDVNFGDSNSVSDVKSAMPNLLQNITHTYATHGVYPVSVTIYNNASSKSYSRNVHVGGPISNFTTNINRMFVPLGFPLIVTSDVDYGSLLTYTYNFGDNSPVLISNVKSYPTATDVVQHVYNNSIDYVVNVSVSNSFNSFSQVLDVKVQEMVQGLILTSDAPVRINTTMTFILTMVESGTDTCFVWDFDDGTKLLYGVPTCTDRPEYANIEFVPASGSTFVVSHTYWVEDSYNVTVNSSNEVSWDFVALTVSALEFLCIEPEVEILGMFEDGLNPIVIKRSKSFKISANVDTQCVPPVNTVYEWSIQKVTVTGNSTDQTDVVLEVITPPANGLPSMTVPERYLDYGLYKFSLNVSYEKGSSLSSIDFAYVEIVKSQLYPKILGDYSRTVFVGDDLVLDGTSSFDPDSSNGTDTGFQYRWFCRLETEDFLLDSSGIPQNVLAISSGGCFGTGIAFLDQSTDMLVIPSANLTANIVYVFVMIITKDTRMGWMEQRVTALTTAVTALSIRCCDNCGRKTSANHPLRLETVCEDCTPVHHQQNIPFLWELFIIQSGNVYQSVNLSGSTPLGTTALNLMLSEDLLQPGLDYRVRVTSDSLVTEKELTVNYPPYGGHCFPNRQLGMEFETKFVIFCENWLDEGDRDVPDPVQDVLKQEPITFKFSYKIRGSTSPPHVFYEVTGTQVHTPELFLQSGLEMEQHYIDIIVMVSDSGGSYNVTQFPVKVVPRPGSVMAVYDSVSFQRFEAEKDITSLLLINMGVLEKMKELKNTVNSTETVTPEMTETVIGKVAERADWVETPAQVELLADIFNTVLEDPEELTLNSKENLLSIYQSLNNSMDTIFNGSADTSRQRTVAKDIMGSYINMMRANVFHSNCTSTECNSQRSLAESTHSLFESRDKLVEMMLKATLPGERPVQMVSVDGDITYQLQRVKTLELSNSTIDLAGRRLAEFPDMTSYVPASFVDLELMESSKLQQDVNSTVQTRTTIVALHDKGSKLDIKDTTEPVRVTIYSDDEMESHLVDVAENFTGEPFYIRVALNRTDVTIIVDLIPMEENENVTFEYFVSYKKVPSSDDNEINGTLPLEDEPDNPWKLVLDMGSFSTEETGFASQLNADNPSVYIGLLPLHNINTTSSLLNVTMYTAGCQYWNTKAKEWKNNGLSYGKKTDKAKVECLTNHMTSFGASFFVPPNTIDFQNVFSKFSDIGNNAAVFATVTAVIGLYFILVFFVRRADKKDVEKWSVLPMKDNLPSDVYHYQVTVYTGMRRHAGTKSRVFFVLGGEDGDTEIRAMEAENKKGHERGSVNSYILSVPQTLGHLLFLRIWHDNSAKGIDADWYLSLVLVKDIQTEQKYVFLFDRWLAVDKDDGEVERFMPVSTKEDIESFGHLFGFKARQDLTDGHLWFSVASRPTWSNFSRVQRLSCCLSLLFTTMVANAMWYGTTPSEGTQDVHLGPFTFSPQELTTSFLMSLVVVPINLLIVTLFRKAGPNLKKKSKKNAQHPCAENEVSEKVELPRTITPSGIFTIEKSAEKAHDPRRTSEVLVMPSKPSKKRRMCVFPHWVMYVAWFLTLVSVLVPAFFTILYSLEWGADKSSRWLTSFILSFVESVVLVQPIKVLAVAIVIALIFRKMDIEEAPSDEQKGETLTYREPGKEQYGNYAHPMKPAHRRPYVEKPPDMSTVEHARTYRKKQNRLVDIVKDIGTYVFYLVIVIIICYENRDEKSYRTVENMRNLLVNDWNIPGRPEPIRGFEGISNFKQFWTWTHQRLIPAIYVQTDFRGEPVASRHSSLISDHIHFRVGPPRLRLSRVEEHSCKILPPLNRLITTCNDEYGITNYDDMSYGVGWTTQNTTAGSLYEDSWKYRTTMDLNGAPFVGTFGEYGGGGYVADLGNSNVTADDIITFLKDNKWLDRQTRAVFLELNLYNPFVNLFCAVSLLMEFPPTGSAISFARITPLRLYRYVGPSALFIIITDIIFVAFTIYFIVRLVGEVKSKGRKYLHEFWNFIELLNVMSAILCCAFYGVHYVTTFFTLDDFHEHPGEFVNFQRIVLWDDVFAFMQGFLLFFSMIKLLRLIRFNAKITQLSTTLKKAVGPIFNFFIVFFIFFFAFTQFAYLVFGPVSHEYYSFLTSLETLFSMLLMKVNIDEVMIANSILGPFFLFLFILVVVFILLNMLLSILNDVFTSVRLDKNCRPDDPEMVDFMISELKRVVGFTETAKGVKNKSRRNSRGRSRVVPTDVERWLQRERERSTPGPNDNEEPTTPTPPTSTDMDRPKNLYSMGTKEWLKAMGLGKQSMNKN